MFARAGRRLGDQAQNGRIQPVNLRRELRMAAIHGQDVLRQVIGADGEELRFAGELFGHDGRAGTSTMMPTGTGFSAQILDFFVDDRPGHAPFSQRGDHGEHDVDVAARLGGAQDGADLVRSRSWAGRGPARMPRSPRKGIVFWRDGQIGQRFVAAQIERADDQRLFAAEGAGNGGVGFRLFLFSRRRAPFDKQELRAQQADARQRRASRPVRSVSFAGLLAMTCMR